jgi:uncharacterized DUF497 family protein
MPREFTWNEEKPLSNLKKQYIDFITARMVFDGHQSSRPSPIDLMKSDLSQRRSWTISS